jgi:transposase
MKIDLSKDQKADLEKRHRVERDGRIRDRIKAVLLFSEGWTGEEIAQALRIHPETVYEHLKDYRTQDKLAPTNGGSYSALTQIQSEELISHLAANLYATVQGICGYVQETYAATYSVAGMTKWLHRHKFSYKKPHPVPSKADPIKQAEFIEQYNLLMKTTPEDEPIEFGDGVHPTMATKIGRGWIRTGQEKLIKTIASRSRVNYFGSINLETMSMTIGSHEAINSESMEAHFKVLRDKYPKSPWIHLILDQGPYNKSERTAQSAKKYRIKLHFLPTYSPNLNPIERVWKVMNEYVRNNVVFESKTDFKEALDAFFKTTWDKIANSLKGRINDNFQILKPAPSG